jgi:hypothetical protein
LEDHRTIPARPSTDELPAWRAPKTPRPERNAGFVVFSVGFPEKNFMAKENNRSNREVRKPKAAKPAKSPSPAALLTLGALTPIKQPKPKR